MSRAVAFEIDEDLVREIRQLRSEGKYLGEIADAIDWPDHWKLDRLEALAGPLPRGKHGELFGAGPVYASVRSGVYGGRVF